MTEVTPEKLRAALTLSGGNVTIAARMLGVSRVTIHKWMKRYGITRHLEAQEAV